MNTNANWIIDFYIHTDHSTIKMRAVHIQPQYIRLFDWLAQTNIVYIYI